MSVHVEGQNQYLNDNNVAQNLKTHIATLASDKYEGRETGTKGEEMAAAYIENQFKTIGLVPKGEDGFLQTFEYTDHIEYNKGNSLKIDKQEFTLDSDFYPLIYSSNGSVNAGLEYCGYGIDAPSLQHNDYASLKNLQGKIFVIEYSSPDGFHPHSKYKNYADLRTKITTAEAKGAAAVIFINSDTTVENPEFSSEKFSKISPASIPVLFVQENANTSLKNKSAKSAEISANLKSIKRTGKNIIGFLDNHKDNLIIIGAHYDHLGFGGFGTTNSNPHHEVYNGADDNASGTAEVIELARYLSQGNLTHNNYLFIAFSGEEKGLIGSSYFAKHPTVDLKKVNYMLNLDMVGRLDQHEKKLALYGTGTSPEWNKILPHIQIDSISVKSKASGSGPSDYTSFYLQNIPVLHFFSGMHTDYHKPTDDEDKINYNGMISIMKFITAVIGKTEADGKLIFSKTNDVGQSSENISKPRLSMGVIPDYMYDGKGMKIDGLSSEDKPAAKAGIMKGDILIKLGDYDVVDMMSYMKAMNNFTKGDQTTAVIQRGDEVIHLSVNF